MALTIKTHGDNELTFVFKLELWFTPFSARGSRPDWNLRVSHTFTSRNFKEFAPYVNRSGST